MRLRRLASSTPCHSERGRRMVKRRLVTAVAVIAAACANDQTAAPASPTTSAPLPTVGLQPGPHSAIADVDLPEGTIQCTTDRPLVAAALHQVILTQSIGITAQPTTTSWHFCGSVSPPGGDTTPTGQRGGTACLRATTKGTRARRGDAPLTLVPSSPSGCGPMPPGRLLST